MANVVDVVVGGAAASTYELDLADGWRGRLKDMEIKVLYQNVTDGFEGDVELNTQLGHAAIDLTNWFQPFPGTVLRPARRSLRCFA